MLCDTCKNTCKNNQQSCNNYIQIKSRRNNNIQIQNTSRRKAPNNVTKDINNTSIVTKKERFELVEYDGLSKEHQIFVDEYIRTRNKTKSYLKAFPGCSGYSVASVCACQLFDRPKIREAVEKGFKHLREQMQVDRNFLIERYLRLLDIDTDDIYDSDHNVKPISEWPVEAKWVFTHNKVVKTTKETPTKHGVAYEEMSVFDPKSNIDKKGVLDSLSKLFGFTDVPKGNIFNGPTQIIVGLID